MRTVLAVAVALVLAGCAGPGEKAGGANGPFVSLHGVPATATVGEGIEVELVIEGLSGASDHVGAHYWDVATTSPTKDFALQKGACSHTEGAFPARFTIECTFLASGVHYLRGHLRLADGTDHWGPNHRIVVGPAADAFEVEVPRPPHMPRPGQAFGLDVEVGGEGPVAVAAHFWLDAAHDRDPEASDANCAEMNGSAPGAFALVCTIDQPGRYEARAQVVHVVEGVAFHFWSEPFTVQVA